MRHLVVFTDLDGTLLDHHDYSWDKAKPSLDELRALSIPVIMNSSKTQAEIILLRSETDNTHPYIVENGAAVIIPEGYFSKGEGEHIEYFGPSREKMLQILHQLREEYHFLFEGFADFSDEKVAEITGLSIKCAGLARQRIASEPLIWKDTDEQWDKFCSLISQTELTLTKGGRFVHVMGNTDKGRGVKWLMDRYRGQAANHDCLSIGLGDSANDLPMLKAVDIPVLIPNKAGSGLVINDIDNLIRPEALGPAGWHEAMKQIITEIRDR